jgi:hypothetical protein
MGNHMPVPSSAYFILETINGFRLTWHWGLKQNLSIEISSSWYRLNAPVLNYGKFKTLYHPLTNPTMPKHKLQFVFSGYQPCQFGVDFHYEGRSSE